MCYIESSYINIILKQNKIIILFHNYFSKTILFAFSIKKNNVAPSALPRFPVKLICCIAFGLASRFSCFLKFIVINLLYF